VNGLPGHRAGGEEPGRDRGGLAKSAALAQDISQATLRQVRGVEDVAVAVQSIAAVAVQTEQGAVQSRKTVEELARVADELTSSLVRFKLTD
jgi:twitching motility protein PilJ